MPSKAVALRLPDHIYTAIDAECLTTGLTKSELILSYIVAGLKVPAVIHTPLEVRVMELVTQMVEVIDRIDAIDSKRSSESSRDSVEAGISTPNSSAVTVDPDIQQAIMAVLRPHPDSGYYFRSEYLEQTKILHSYRTQAIQMGFSSEATKIDGKQIRVWLNREYCLQTANTPQTP